MRNLGKQGALWWKTTGFEDTLLSVTGKNRDTERITKLLPSAVRMSNSSVYVNAIRTLRTYAT